MYDDDNSGILKRNMFSLIYGTARGTAAMNEMPCIFHYYFYIDHYYTNINHILTESISRREVKLISIALNQRKYSTAKIHGKYTAWIVVIMRIV